MRKYVKENFIINAIRYGYISPLKVKVQIRPRFSIISRSGPTNDLYIVESFVEAVDIKERGDAAIHHLSHRDERLLVSIKR